MASRLKSATLRAGNLQIRRGSASSWTTINPILDDGEPGYEEGTGKLKIGDGQTSWNDLTYDDATSLSALIDELSETVESRHLLFIQDTEPVTDSTALWIEPGGRIHVQVGEA